MFIKVMLNLPSTSTGSWFVRTCALAALFLLAGCPKPEAGMRPESNQQVQREEPMPEAPRAERTLGSGERDAGEPAKPRGDGDAAGGHPMEDPDSAPAKEQLTAKPAEAPREEPANEKTAESRAFERTGGAPMQHAGDQPSEVQPGEGWFDPGRRRADDNKAPVADASGTPPPRPEGHEPPAPAVEPREQTAEPVAPPPGGDAAASAPTTKPAEQPTQLRYTILDNPTTRAGRGRPSVSEIKSPCVWFLVDGKEGEYKDDGFIWVLLEPVRAAPTFSIEVVPGLAGNIVDVEFYIMEQLGPGDRRNAEELKQYAFRARAEGLVKPGQPYDLCCCSEQFLIKDMATQRELESIPALSPGEYTAACQVRWDSSREPTFVVTRFRVE